MGKIMPSDVNKSSQFRLIVVGIVQNEHDEYLICKCRQVEASFRSNGAFLAEVSNRASKMEAALRRELMEELAIDITDIKPLFFSHGTYKKSFANGDRRDVYVIFLNFSRCAKSTDITLSSEFSEYAWIKRLTSKR